MLDGFVVGCPPSCDFAPPSFPKFRFRRLHATAATNRHRDRRAYHVEQHANRSGSIKPLKLADEIGERSRKDSH